MKENESISFTPEKMKKLHNAYEQARQDKIKVFVFEGREWLTDYAGYVLEYLRGRRG